MNRLLAATVVCAALGVWTLRAETAGTESNYDRLVREGRNVWKLIDSKLIQTNEVGEWAIPVDLSKLSFDPTRPRGIVLDRPSAAAGHGVLDLIDAVIVDKDDQVVVDYASAEGHSWCVWLYSGSLQNLAATDFRCNRLHPTEGWGTFGKNATLKRVTLGGPRLTNFMKYDLSEWVTNLTISAATNLTGFANDAFQDTWRLRYQTFDDLPKLTSFPSSSLVAWNSNWPLREVVFLGKPFNAACMTNLLNGVETEASNALSGDTPCRVYISKRQWPYAERVASGYWKPATAESGLTEAELARKPEGCLGIIDVSNANVPHRAWVLHRDSPYDEKRPGFCVLVK